MARRAGVGGAATTCLERTFYDLDPLPHRLKGYTAAREQRAARVAALEAELADARKALAELEAPAS